MTEKVRLKINGQVHEGWVNCDVTMAINALCSSFSLSLQQARSIRVGMPVELWIGDTKILDGFIEKRNAKLTKQSVNFSLEGRDKTADLIDCSAVNSPGSWKNAKLETIAAAICAPFGIKVVVNGDTGANFTAFAIEQGETAFDALSRLARLRGVLLTTNSSGELIIDKVQTTPQSWAFVLGENIEELDFDEDTKERFSEYRIKGQHSYARTVAADDARAPNAVAYDKGITRYRPLIVISDDQATKMGLQTLANFEASSRLARSQKVTITYPKWRAPNGALFQTGMLVPIRAPMFEIDLQLVLSELRFSHDKTSKTATLTFVRPESFTQEPPPEQKEKTKAIKPLKTSKGEAKNKLKKVAK